MRVRSRMTVMGAAAMLCAAHAAGAQEPPAGAGGGFGAVSRALVEAEQQPMRASGVRVPMESRLVKGAPYSAEVVIENVQVLADGNRITNRTTGRVMRDSEGRTRREEDKEPGRAAMIAITDPVAGMSISMDPETRTAYKTAGAMARTLVSKITSNASDPAEIERRRAVETEMAAQARTGGAGASAGAGGRVMLRRSGGPAWDEKVEKLPARTIEGVMAEGTRVTRTIPAGAIGNDQPIVTTTEEWVSRDLGVLVLTRASDPRAGEHTYRLLNIVRAEPGASWFEIPPDYTVKESGVKRLAPAVRSPR